MSFLRVFGPAPLGLAIRRVRLMSRSYGERGTTMTKFKLCVRGLLLASLYGLAAVGLRELVADAGPILKGFGHGVSIGMAILGSLLAISVPVVIASSDPRQIERLKKLI